MTDPNPSSSIPHVPHVPVRPSWRARAFVLGGLALALAVTVFSVVIAIGARFLGGHLVLGNDLDRPRRPRVRPVAGIPIW